MSTAPLAAPPAPLDVAVRETSPADVAALNALYRRLTGIERSERQFHWEWVGGPYGPAPSWVLVDAATDRVIGHHGVVPLPLWDGRRTVAAARTENTMLEPEARGRFAYHRVEARLLKLLLERFQVVFTTAGKGAQALVRKRLGYEAEGRWQTFLFPPGPLYLLRRAVGPLAPARLWPARDGLDAVEDAGRLARLWQECRPAAGWSAERSAEFLHWRLFAHPYHRHHAAILHRQGRDLAAIAWHEAAGPRGTVDIIVDDVFGRDGADCRDVLRALAAGQRGRAARVGLRTLHDSPLARLALAAGGRAVAGGSTELLVRHADPAARQTWEATGVLGQGIDVRPAAKVAKIALVPPKAAGY